MKAKPEPEEIVDGIAEDEELHSLTHYVGNEELLVKHMFAAIQHTKLEAMMPPVLKAIPLQDLQLLCVHELRGISKKRIIAIIQGRDMSDSSGSEEEDEEELLRQAAKSTRLQRRRAGSRAADSPDPSKPLDIVELEMRARLIQTMLKKDPKNKTIPPLDDIKAQIKSEPLSDRSYSSSRSRSRSRSGSRSYSSRSYSRSSSSRSSSYSDSEGRRRKRRSRNRSRRRDRRGRRRRSHRDSSKKRGSSRDDSAATPDKDGEKRRQAKKTRISRKEFEDRMRRAKENRTYRKRTDSEDETKKVKEGTQAEEAAERPAAPRRQHDAAKDTEEKASEKHPAENESEKEEGEIDSNEEEEEEGEDVPFSTAGSPRRKSRHRSRSLSSISSVSDRSRSGRRAKRAREKRHKRRKDHRAPVDKNLILATLNAADPRGAAQASSRSRAKAGIEAVDSEEDFDSLGNGGGSREVIRPDASVGLRTDRSNVSFSFNKKTAPSLMSGTDFEFGMSYNAPPSSGPLRTQPPPLGLKKSNTGDQIVISSDSESEQRPAKKARKNSAENPMFIDDDANDVATNISDQNDLKLCEETVMKDIFDNMEDEEEEEEETNKQSARTDANVKSEPMDPTENDVHTSAGVERVGSSGPSSSAASRAVKRERESPGETQSVNSSANNKAPRKEPDSEEGACTDEDSNEDEKKTTPFVNSFHAVTGGAKGEAATNGPGPDVDHRRSNGDACNNVSDEDVGLVDLPEDEHFALDVDDDDSNQQSKYDDTIDPAAEGGDDSEVTADRTDFYRGVENLSVSEDNSMPAPPGSQMNAELEQKSESEEEGEIEDDVGLVELEPGEAEELSGLGAAPPGRPRGQRGGGTEIIGEIEPSKDAAGLENLGESGSSWSSRWLQSEKVQKVVTNSKMLSRMRKRIKIDKINAKAGAATAPAADDSQKPEETAKDDAAPPAATVPVINSMEEYKKLLGKTDAAEGAAAAAPDAAAQDKGDDENEASSDDSDEDLWSKMMGN